MLLRLLLLVSFCHGMAPTKQKLHAMYLEAWKADSVAPNDLDKESRVKSLANVSRLAAQLQDIVTSLPYSERTREDDAIVRQRQWGRLLMGVFPRAHFALLPFAWFPICPRRHPPRPHRQ